MRELSFAASSWPCRPGVPALEPNADKPALLIAVHNTPAIQVIRTQLHRHSVARQDADEVLPHSPGHMSQNLMLILQLYLEHGVGQRFHHHSHYLNRVFLRQT